MKLYNGDCLKIMEGIKDKSIDLILTDVPYGEVNRKSNGLRNLDKGKADILTFNLDVFIDNLCRISKGSIYVFCGTEQVSNIRARMVLNKLSTRLCIWQKNKPISYEW